MFVASCLLVACLVQADQTVFRELDLESARALAADEERLLLVAFVEPGAELLPEFEALFEDPEIVAWINAQAIAIRLVEAPKVRMGGESSWVSWQPSLTVVAADGKSFTRVEGWPTHRVMDWLKACQSGHALDDMRALYTPDEAKEVNQVLFCQMLLQRRKPDECAELLLINWDQTVVTNLDPQWDRDLSISSGTDRMFTRVMTEFLLAAMNKLDQPSRIDPFFERLVKLEIDLRNGAQANDPDAWDDWMCLAGGLSLTDRTADLLLARGEPMRLSEWDFNSRNGLEIEHLIGPSGYLRAKLYDWALADPGRLELIPLLPDFDEYAQQLSLSLEGLLEKPEKTPDDPSLTGRIAASTKWLFNQGDKAHSAIGQAKARALARAWAWATCMLHKRDADAQAIAQSFADATDDKQVRDVWFDEAARWTDAPADLPVSPFGIRRDQ
ncbi:MAG: hypothetical protein ACI9EF_000621 [Pseudohongiellaceae bacterium]|jgi:hypothetical protein